jgi:hypothetical protein
MGGALWALARGRGPLTINPALSGAAAQLWPLRIGYSLRDDRDFMLRTIAAARAEAAPAASDEPGLGQLLPIVWTVYVVRPEFA